MLWAKKQAVVKAAESTHYTSSGALRGTFLPLL